VVLVYRFQGQYPAPQYPPCFRTSALSIALKPPFFQFSANGGFMCQSGRIYNCERCNQQVIICSRCDRGNIYCAGQCADLARKEKQAETQKRYLESDKGRKAHARNQDDYRQRQKEKVIYQSSQYLVHYDELITGESIAKSPSHQVLNENAVSENQQRAVKQEIFVTNKVTSTENTDNSCHFCGCRCSEELRWAKLYRQNRHAGVAQRALDSFPKPAG